MNEVDRQSGSQEILGRKFSMSLLKKGNVQICETAPNWQDAIRISVLPLEQLLRSYRKCPGRLWLQKTFDLYKGDIWKMLRLSGKAVYKGVVLGKVVVVKKNEQPVKRIKITDIDAQISRLEKAGEEAQKQLRKLYNKAVKEVGETSAAIFEVHQMMLEDEDYMDAIHSMIRTEMVNAEYAVAVTGDNFSEMFASMDDDYMRADRKSVV